MAEYLLDDMKGLVLAAQNPPRLVAVTGSPPQAAIEPLFNVPKTIQIISDRLDLSLSEAKQFVYEVMLGLADGDYYETSPVPPPPADVYGTFAQAIGWYIKFKILIAPRLNICGFHPPERPFRTRCGSTIR